MSVSIPIIVWFENNQPNYLHANTCHNVQTKYTMKSRVLTDFFSVLARYDILLSDFHDANGAFKCSL